MGESPASNARKVHVLLWLQAFSFGRNFALKSSLLTGRQSPPDYRPAKHLKRHWTPPPTGIDLWFWKCQPASPARWNETFSTRIHASLCGISRLLVCARRPHDRGTLSRPRRGYAGDLGKPATAPAVPESPKRASPAFARWTFSLELRRIRSGRGRSRFASSDAALHRSSKLQVRDFHRPRARSLSRHEQPDAGLASGRGIGRRPNRRALSGHETAPRRSNEGSRGPACPGGGSPLGGCVSFSLQPRSLSW